MNGIKIIELISKANQDRQINLLEIHKIVTLLTAVTTIARTATATTVINTGVLAVWTKEGPSIMKSTWFYPN